MEIKHNEEILKLEYSFNSFKFMEELNMEDLSELDIKPFKMIGIAEILLTGALNHNPKVIYNEVMINDILVNITNEGKLVELLEHLIDKLQESSFFKSLQKTEVKKSKKK